MFLYYYLYSIQSYIQEHYVRYSTGLGHVDMVKLKLHKIPVPPIDIQNQFVSIYEEKERKVKELEADITNSENYLKHLDELGQSIIKNIVSGLA